MVPRRNGWNKAPGQTADPAVSSPRSGQQLVWATTKRVAVDLKAEAKSVLNGVRRDRALPVVEQYQWIAAAAFANPVPQTYWQQLPSTAQLVMELGGIYQQKFLQQAAADNGKPDDQTGLVTLPKQSALSQEQRHHLLPVARCRESALPT